MYYMLCVIYKTYIKNIMYITYYIHITCVYSHIFINVHIYTYLFTIYIYLYINLCTLFCIMCIEISAWFIGVWELRFGY